jgi:hypothetical protein
MRNLLKRADPLSYTKALTAQVLGEIRKEETATASREAKQDKGSYAQTFLDFVPLFQNLLIYLLVFTFSWIILVFYIFQIYL